MCKSSVFHFFHTIVSIYFIFVLYIGLVSLRVIAVYEEVGGDIPRHTLYPLPNLWGIPTLDTPQYRSLLAHTSTQLSTSYQSLASYHSAGMHLYQGYDQFQNIDRNRCHLHPIVIGNKEKLLTRFGRIILLGLTEPMVAKI